MTSVRPLCASPPLDPVVEGFIQSYEQEKLEEKAVKLVEKAAAFFTRLPPLFPVEYTPTENTSELIIRNIFEKQLFQGVCIGEIHTHWASKKVVIDLLSSVDIVFLELLKKDKIQSLLDRWREKKDEMDMPEELLAELGFVDHKYQLPPFFSYTRLVKEAKKTNTRVVAIDSSTAAGAGVHPHQTLKSRERIIGLNYTAKKIMDWELKHNPGRFIILTGTNHSSKLEKAEIPGLSELMQCPCFIISDTTCFKKQPAIHNTPTSTKQLGFLNEPKAVHSIMIIEKPALPS